PNPRVAAAPLRQHAQRLGQDLRRPSTAQPMAARNVPPAWRGDGWERAEALQTFRDAPNFNLSRPRGARESGRQRDALFDNNFEDRYYGYHSAGPLGLINRHQQIQYQRPNFTNNTNLYTDLLAYAPGLNTTM